MKKTAMFVFAIALCSTSLRAQKLETVEWNAGFPLEGVEQDAPAALTKIFSNLGAPTKAYAGSAWVVRGPNLPPPAPAEQFIALPFRSAKAAHVQQVSVAIQYSSGANQINLSLYSDSSGHPGTLLAGPVTVKNVPTYFHCCKLATATFTSSVAITAGTQYWVVADTPSSGTGSDFNGTWSWVTSKATAGGDQGSGWYSFQTVENPAGAVYGTIP